MKWAIVAALCVLALAGCLADETESGETPPTSESNPFTLQFRPAFDLGSVARIGAAGTNCQDSIVDGDCGLGEPSVEVDGAGTIYVSGVCCLTNPPPVYVSRDGGETFTDLATDTGVRELFGIEGDFAIDEMGRIYFSDIEFVGTFQMTVWDAEGNFERHTKWPAPPLVDRDWVRAEGDGIVYYVYNTALDTKVYKSTDAGATFTPVSIFDAGYGLGNVAIRPGVELCLFGGSISGHRSVDCSLDGGGTWTQFGSELPTGDDSYPVGAFDEAGNLYLAETIDGQIKVSKRGPAETFYDASTQTRAETAQQLTNGAVHTKPWLAAGKDGAVAIAWYGVATVNGTEAWYLHVGATADFDGGAWDVQIADPEPVFVGDLQRELLDFLQIDFGPDGAVHVAYSKLPNDGTTEEQLTYIRSEPTDLGMGQYWWGP